MTGNNACLTGRAALPMANTKARVAPQAAGALEIGLGCGDCGDAENLVRPRAESTQWALIFSIRHGDDKKLVILRVMYYNVSTTRRKATHGIEPVCETLVEGHSDSWDWWQC